MQKSQNVIDSCPPAEAMLSHSPEKQIDDRLATECDAFDEAHQQPHVRQQGGRQHGRLLQDDPLQLQRVHRLTWRGPDVDGRTG